MEDLVHMGRFFGHTQTHDQKYLLASPVRSYNRKDHVIRAAVHPKQPCPTRRTATGHQEQARSAASALSPSLPLSSNAVRPDLAHSIELYRTRRILATISPFSPHQGRRLAFAETLLGLDALLDGGANNLGRVVEVTKVCQTSLSPELGHLVWVCTTARKIAVSLPLSQPTEQTHSYDFCGLPTCISTNTNRFRLPMLQERSNHLATC